MGTARWLTPASGYLEGYTHTLNPYVGCSFGCSYCYVRRLPVGLFRSEPWGSWVDAKKAEPLKLMSELAKAKSKGSVAIFFSSATDPYQPIEVSAQVTRSLLEVMVDEPPDFVLLQTRSPLVVRDMDLLQQLKDRVRVSMTVETDREDVRRVLTPSAPPLAGRLNALRQLRDAGIDTQAAVSPILPHTPDFARLLSVTAPRVVVDDFFSGDGSGGRRSEVLGMRPIFEQNGWISWYDPSVIGRFVDSLRPYMPEAAIGVNAAGFAPPEYKVAYCPEDTEVALDPAETESEG
ncbi:SPL family radical SAM protein [Cohnella silvisoli]|uniref:Radical SAM protein n=1 Tax=Cohnella silvisoli TaxID=2873699 RepID=A0ABV1KZ13_9BACL|nr:radical SAM protein [Cohnella silvisoli]MCD9024297.1 radical SAM protein [Cohnella silvisoli]